MTRYGAQFGPDITFLGTDRCELGRAGHLRRRRRRDPGRPVRRGHVTPGGYPLRAAADTADLLPAARRVRPSLALRVDALQDLRVYDAGDVEMFSGDAARSVRDLQEAVYTVTASGAIPLVLGGDHTITWPDAAGVAQHVGQGRVSLIDFDAHADTGDIEFGSLIGHGQPMRRLIESGAVRGDRFRRSACAGTGGGRRPSSGWRASACAPTR